ncbi:MAG: vitamin K epoxide reductase family protein [Candidatus Magasanikbacteria bacterium]|nr:vitamin K epoxide reductase family protein [Candidatus Magasanikbacteria bacterium]
MQSSAALQRTLRGMISSNHMSKKIFATIFLVLALLGFLDASYLTLQHYRGVVPPCAIVSGCEQVTTSQYSLIFGIPVALLGALYYLTILILSIAHLDTKRDTLLKYAAYFTACGLLASLWFIFLQAFVIKAWCIYCLGSATTSILLFIAGIIYLHRQSKTATTSTNTTPGSGGAAV